MGRRRFLTLQASNLGRRLTTRRKSEPSTRASRRRKVKTGTMSETRELRISGHMPQMRQNSSAVKPMEYKKSTVDLMSSRDAQTMGGWSLMREKRSRPMESR